MRILVSVMPFAGHVAPLSGVVAELRRRGHDVMVYSGSRYRDRFEALGAEFTAWRNAADFDEHDITATFPRTGRPGPLGLLANLEELFIGTAPGQARDLGALIADVGADVLVGDVMSYGPGMVAELTGVPWVTVSVVPLSSPSRDLPPTGLALHPARGSLGRVRDRLLWAAMAPMVARLDRSFGVARRAVGLPAGSPFAQAGLSPTATILTGSPSIEYPRSDLPSGHEFVGRIPAAGQGRTVGRRPHAGRPRVLVTQGTFNTDPRELIQPALRALAGDDVEVIVTTGRRGDLDVGIPVPANATVADFLDYPAVLPTLDAVVTNGGWGGTLEFLATGLPVVVAGGDLDKPEIAARVAWSGAGVDLRTGRPRATAVGRAVRRVLTEPSYGAAARRIASELALLGGVQAAADIIERVASGRARRTIG
jgi:MGT family glycosyltransferase